MRRMIPDNEWKKQVEDLKSLLAGYTSDDASTKKIYQHSITFLQSSSSTIQWFATFNLFNNDATPIDTYEKVIVELDKIYDALPEGVSYARIMCSGTCANASNWVIIGAIEINGKTDSTRKFTGRNGESNNTININFSTLDYQPRVFDNVIEMN